MIERVWRFTDSTKSLPWMTGEKSNWQRALATCIRMPEPGATTSALSRW